MALNLDKGGSAALRGDQMMVVAMFGLGWDASASPGTQLDLDASLIARDAAGNAVEPGVCFYGQLDINWAKHSGDSRGGEGELDTTGDDERIWVDLQNVPAGIQSIDLVVHIYEAAARKQTFGNVNKGKIRFVSASRMGDPSGEEKITCDVTNDDIFSATGILFVQLVRKGPTWDFRRVDNTDSKFATLKSTLASPSLPA